MRTSGIAAIGKFQLFLHAKSMFVHLPAGRTVRARRDAKNLYEPFGRHGHLMPGPPFSPGCNVVLPANVIIAMNPDVKACVAHLTHDRGRLSPNVRPRKQRAITQRLKPVIGPD